LAAESTGDVLNKAIADVDICSEGMRKVLTEVFDTGVLMASYLISMLFYDMKLTIVACVFVPVAMWIAEKLKKIIVRYSKDARSMSSRVSTMTYDKIEQTVLMRIHGLEHNQRQEYFDQLKELEQKQIKAVLVETLMQPIYQVIAMLSIAYVIYEAGQHVIDNSWSIGTFLAYLTIYTAVAVKASKAANLFNSYHKAKVSWKRIVPYLQEYQVDDESDEIHPLERTLRVENLTFSYPGNEEVIVKSISFSLKPGHKLGVTGPIACGKSALAVALTGMYPYQGSIKLNGIELSEYSKVQKSNRISYLTHNPELLSDSIYQNITLGVDGDIMKELEQVCFLEDLQSMPEGIHTLVGNHGVRLSGGQQARICLARALYHKSDVLILDDPFSAVDKTTEHQIIHNIMTNYQERKVIILSHRLAIFPKLDEILIINSDKTVEAGTHDQLLGTSTSYASLYQLQLGGRENE
jgi:ABC-type bacteriocin/lantibiotic exporter with double-glycine peptidase domain